ncbi:MAG TPA: bacteriocin [Chloroflexia bacterium]|nr:bacteriocin [Chloroflexia bacterium]
MSEVNKPLPANQEPSQDLLNEAELSEAELNQVVGGNKALLATTISNLANMRHEMLKVVANNLRS